MYKTQCATCGKEMFTYAINKRGDLPKVYCSRKCEANAKYEKRFDVRLKNDSNSK